MSIDSVATAAVYTFPNIDYWTPLGYVKLPVVMVAISGAESTFGTDDAGPRNPNGYNCDGHGYWGAWQVSLRAHAGWLQRHVGSDSPCDWADWLLDDMHCARAALHIMGSGYDLTAWQTFTQHTYLKFIRQASEAVDAAQKQLQAPPVNPVAATTVSAPAIAGLVIAGYVLAAGSAVG